MVNSTLRVRSCVLLAAAAFLLVGGDSRLGAQDRKPSTTGPIADPEILARHPIHKLLAEVPDAPDAMYSLAEIAAAIAEYENRLANLPSFVIHSKSTGVVQGAPSEYGHPVAGFEQIIARHDGAWFAMSTQLLKEGFYPYRAWWRDGISLSQEYRHYSIVHGPGARFTSAQLYTYLMGLDILQTMPGSEQVSKEGLRHSLLAKDFHAKLEQYKVLPKQRQVDGAWCHVVHFPGFQTLWVDANMGFVIRRRVYNWHVNGGCERVVHQKGFKELEDGLYFPLKVVDDLYAQPLQIEKEFWNQITATTTSEILRIEVPVVDASIFEIPLTRGAEVHDFVRKRQFVIGDGNEEPFEEALEFSRRMGSRSWSQIGLVLGALSGLLLASVFVRKAILLRRQIKGRN